MQGDSTPRVTRRGGSLRIRLQELSFISHLVLGHRRRSIRRAAAAGGSGRALKARPDLRLPGPGRMGPVSGPKGGWRRGFGQDKAFIRAEGWVAEGVRAGWGFHTGRRVGAEGWLRVGVGGTKGAAEVQAFPPSAIRCSAVGGAGATLRPWQTVFRATRGARPSLRPAQPLFRAAGGARPSPCPWQTVFRAAEGAGATLRPRQTVFRATRGAGPPPCPWQTVFRAAGGAGARLCPGRAHYLRLRRFSSARKASALRLWSARVRAKTCVPEKSGLAQK